MEISTLPQGDCMEVSVTGRLDESWTSHLDSALSSVIREGAHHVRLNMHSVTYLSSAGIRILVQFYKQLSGINGSFAVIQPSAAVRKILDMTRLSPILLSEGPDVKSGPAPLATTARKIETANAVFEVSDYFSGESLSCQMYGDPTLLEHSEYREEHMRTISFPETAFGLGLGAFGSAFADCRSRFGEFLAVAGAAGHLPTDGSGVPDYLISAGTFIPEIKALYGITCHGQFANLVRFDAVRQVRAIRLTDLVNTCLDITGSSAAGIVMLAETGGLVGAALRQSPARDHAAETVFSHPEIRNWISFTAEPAYVGSLCLAVGIATREPPAALRPYVRTMGKQSGSPYGHFHAAVFPYRPIQKGELDLRVTVRSLFETQILQGILHLFADPRELAGPGESEFIRGACWLGPITSVANA